MRGTRTGSSGANKNQTGGRGGQGSCGKGRKRDGNGPRRGTVKK